MIRIPTRIQQAPYFVRQLLERSAILNRPAPKQQTFHLCFFSCQSYFRYLYCSLHSLVKHAHNHSLKVLIFSDEEMPLSVAQIEAIIKLIPDARIISWPKSMGWGATQIEWIWRAYKLAAKDAADNDIVARIDSDVFFFNDRIFNAVARCDADLVGDGHFVDFKYAQGGCYFFRASAIHKITALMEVEPLEKLLNEVDIAVEDIVAHHLAKRLNLKIWLTWFMMFPDEIKNAGGLTAWQRWKFSCAHFVMKNKITMLETYADQVLRGNSPQDYQKTLDIP